MQKTSHQLNVINTSKDQIIHVLLDLLKRDSGEIQFQG